jgi:hypothetical protein
MADIKVTINTTASPIQFGSISIPMPSYVDDVIELLALSAAAPSECVKDDMYYNANDKKIYTATGTNTWGTTGRTPKRSKIYVDLSTDMLYRWGGSAMVLITSSDMVAISNAEVDIIVAS